MNASDLRHLGVHVADREDVLLDAASSDERTRSAIATRAAARTSARNVNPRLRMRSTAAAAAVGVALGLGASTAFFYGEGSDTAQEALSFTVGEPARPGTVGEWASASPGQKLPIRFSDGSALTLRPDARGRVARVAARGAELVIESGHAEIHVVPREQSEWRVRTGPFVVDVTGTHFEVGWRPDKDELEVRVFEGGVRVSGCALTQGHAVRRGQELRASCGRGDLSVAPISTEPPAVSTTEKAKAAEPPPANKPVRKAAPRESWQELARRGRYADAYALAAASGFEAECRRVSASEVLELADAARLAGRANEARFAYTTLRGRFAGSDAAARAAFELGRAAYQSGQTSDAAQWFQAYLAERPGGALAPVALGRLLEASVRLGDRSRAQTIAKRYVELYPAGPHADEARKVLGLDPSVTP